MEENKMIMDDVVETKVSDAEMANVVTRTQYAPTSQQFVRPRQTRTIIRKFDKKIMSNDTCPCGSGKKFKKCCRGNGNYDGRRELSAQEMAQCRYENKLAWRFKESIH